MDAFDDLINRYRDGARKYGMRLVATSDPANPAVEFDLGKERIRIQGANGVSTLEAVGGWLRERGEL